jgi:predicted SprT family Zn-dependent metalloprotease
MTNTVKAIQAVEASLEVADEKYGTNLSGNVRIRCDIRGHKVAGQARWRTNRFSGDTFDYELRLNPRAIENTWHETLTDTIPHEVAHLVCVARPELGRNHDAGWKRVCRALGGTGERLGKQQIVSDAERQAAYDARRPYIYIDSKGKERRLTAQRHKHLQEGKITKRGGIRRYMTDITLQYSDNKGTINKDSFVRKETKAKVKAAPKARKPQARAKKGQMTKAQIARNLIKLHFPAGPDQLNQEQIIAKIADVCGLSKGLAKTYFNNNLTKAMMEK